MNIQFFFLSSFPAVYKSGGQYISNISFEKTRKKKSFQAEFMNIQSLQFSFLAWFPAVLIFAGLYISNVSCEKKNKKKEN